MIMIFYHSRLADEPTGTIEYLYFFWFLSNVANIVETKVLHKMTLSQELPNINLLFKMYALYYTDALNIL